MWHETRDPEGQSRKEIERWIEEFGEGSRLHAFPMECGMPMFKWLVRLLNVRYDWG